MSNNSGSSWLSKAKGKFEDPVAEVKNEKKKKTTASHRARRK